MSNLKIRPVNGNRYCFVIAHRYVQGYKTFIDTYIRNINDLHPNSLIIVVDNNSVHPLVNRPYIKENRNLIYLTNNTTSKFEIGAYTVALTYLLRHNLDSLIDFIVFSQDNYILKNAIPAGTLRTNGAAVLATFDYFELDMVASLLFSRLGLSHGINNIALGCWCSSFMICSSLASDLRAQFLRMSIGTRAESQAGERVISKILQILTSNQITSLDGRSERLPYDPWSIQLDRESVRTTFAKRLQQKTEKTSG